MKPKLTFVLLILAMAIALPFVTGAETKSLRSIADAKESPQKFERRVFPGPRAPVEKESVTFLGVETSPVHPTLSAQLNLPKDSGLVIVSVAPDSPAANALQTHDVLRKLDDQILVEPRQLAVLIRNHKEGDEVTLTYIRAGKETTAKVKLAKHDVPKMAAMGAVGFGADQPDMFFTRPAMPGMPREEMDRVLSLIDQGQHRGPGGGGAGVQNFRFEGPGMRSTAVNTTNSNMVFSDDRGSLDLTAKDGKKTLVAKNPKGETIFSGPVDTPEERKALPPELRERLDHIEGMQDFSFRTDQDFVPGRMKVMRVPPEGIAMPAPGTFFEAPTPGPSPRIF